MGSKRMPEPYIWNIYTQELHEKRFMNIKENQPCWEMHIMLHLPKVYIQDQLCESRESRILFIGFHFTFPHWITIHCLSFLVHDSCCNLLMLWLAFVLQSQLLYSFKHWSITSIQDSRELTRLYLICRWHILTASMTLYTEISVSKIFMYIVFQSDVLLFKFSS